MGRVLYTRNAKDYAVLSADYAVAERRHAGIVALSDVQVSIGLQLAAFSRLDSEIGAEALRGQIWYLLNFA